MARPLRIEYPDALYHVMNRGRRGQDIFLEDDEVSQKPGGVKWPVCLGPQTFIDRIKEKYGSGKINKEIPCIPTSCPYG